MATERDELHTVSCCSCSQARSHAMPSSVPGIAVCDGQLDYMCRRVQYMASRLELVHVGLLVSGLQTTYAYGDVLFLFLTFCLNRLIAHSSF